MSRFGGVQLRQGISMGLTGIFARWIALIEVLSFRGPIYLAIVVLALTTEKAIGQNLESGVVPFSTSWWHFGLLLILCCAAASLYGAFYPQRVNGKTENKVTSIRPTSPKPTRKRTWQLIYLLSDLRCLIGVEF